MQFNLKSTFFLFVTMVIIYSCKSDDTKVNLETTQTLSKSIPGTWQITLMKVDIASYQTEGRDSTFEAREENWENQFQVKPFRIYFDKENKFHQTFRGRDNSLISEYYGVWSLKGDTLTMVQSDQTLEYKIQIEKGQIFMTSLMDWDGDQVEDDTYFSKQRRISARSVE